MNNIKGRASRGRLIRESIYYPVPRIDVGIEVTADGCFYTASIWLSLVRPVRLESMHAGEVIEAMFTIVEALA